MDMKQLDIEGHRISTAANTELQSKINKWPNNGLTSTRKPWQRWWWNNI